MWGSLHAFAALEQRASSLLKPSWRPPRCLRIKYKQSLCPCHCQALCRCHCRDHRPTVAACVPLAVADGPFRRALSLLVYNLLLPALNLYNIAGQVSASTVLEYVPFVLNVLFG